MREVFAVDQPTKGIVAHHVYGRRRQGVQHPHNDTLVVTITPKNLKYILQILRK